MRTLGTRTGLTKPKTKEADQSLFDLKTAPEVSAPRKGDVVVMPPPAPQNMLAIIASAAANPAVDVAKMKELLAMQREIERDEQERAFNVAMHAAQSDMPRIAKDKKADRFSYATLENISTQIDPIARKHGFVLSYGTAPPVVPGNIAMVVDVMHTAGCLRRYTAPEVKPDTTGLKDGKNKTDTQGAGASVSYMRRYLKCMVFDVIIADEDIDGARAKKKGADPGPDGEGLITQKQADQLTDLCEAVECSKDKFLAYMKIGKLADLPANLFDAAVGALRRYEDNRKEQAATK